MDNTSKVVKFVGGPFDGRLQYGDHGDTLYVDGEVEPFEPVKTHKYVLEQTYRYVGWTVLSDTTQLLKGTK